MRTRKARSPRGESSLTIPALLSFLTVAAACACSSAGQEADARASARNRPNVLLVVSEDNGPHFGCYGDANLETPNLDRLAAQGVRFERAFVATASCSESRSSILTGL